MKPSILSKFRPALIDALAGYTRANLMRDIMAGVMVGIVALPLSIAFGIASGVSPEQGLITAVIAGFIISALGGSRTQIGGPTGAFIVIIYSIVMRHGTSGLMIATLMAGVILILMGMFKLGSVIKYIPYPVIVGFTAGIAVVIFAGQIRDVLGLAMTTVPADFVEKLVAYARHLGSANPFAIGVSAVTIAIILTCRKFAPQIPEALLALVVTTIGVSLCSYWGICHSVETIGSRFPNIVSGMAFPSPELPSCSWVVLRELFVPACSIAMLAAIESLLSAVVADGMTGDRHRSNTELIAQGVANIASPLFGGIPATGAIARTATNIKMGGRTPVAGIIHAITLFVIMLFLGRYAALIPMATLGGIVAIVAWDMSEFHRFRAMFRSTKSDCIIMVVTFLLTVFIDLTVAIQSGFVLAAILFIKRVRETSDAGYVSPETHNPDTELPHPPAGCEVFEISGPMFFGAADRFHDALRITGQRPKILILRLRHVHSCDITALNTLSDILRQCRSEHVRLILTGVRPQPRFLMQKSGFINELGAENLFPSYPEAIESLLSNTNEHA